MWIAAVVTVGGLLVGALVWRKASERRRVPCPWWLGWVLENPYSRAIAGSAVLLDRADVQSGMRVLDVGAGPGRVSIPAAERVGPTGEVVAVDVQQAMLDRLQARAGERGVGNVYTLHGAIEELTDSPQLRAASFDRALVVTVLGEIPDRREALEAIRAALRPGGILSITEFLPDPHFMSRRTVRRLAESTGFQFDHEYGWPVAFTVNFRKAK